MGIDLVQAADILRAKKSAHLAKRIQQHAMDAMAAQKIVFPLLQLLGLKMSDLNLTALCKSAADTILSLRQQLAASNPANTISPEERAAALQLQTVVAGAMHHPQPSHAISSGNELAALNDPNLGRVMVTADGMPLYTYVGGTPTKSDTWRPFLSVTVPTGIEGISVGIDHHVMWNGMKLYTRSHDEPGKVGGNGVAEGPGVWAAVVVTPKEKL